MSKLIMNKLIMKRNAANYNPKMSWKVRLNLAVYSAPKKSNLNFK